MTARPPRKAASGRAKKEEIAPCGFSRRGRSCLCTAGAYYNKENKKPYICCLNRCTDFFAFFMFVIYFIIRCPSCQYQIQKKSKNFQHTFERIILRCAGAENMVLCTSIQTIDEHETDTHGGGVHTQMSREAWPIQIAIIGAEGQISDALQAFSGTCCAAMDRSCRCAVFSDAEDLGRWLQSVQEDDALWQ